MIERRKVLKAEGQNQLTFCSFLVSAKGFCAKSSTPMYNGFLKFSSENQFLMSYECIARQNNQTNKYSQGYF